MAKHWDSFLSYCKLTYIIVYTIPYMMKYFIVTKVVAKMASSSDRRMAMAEGLSLETDSEVTPISGLPSRQRDRPAIEMLIKIARKMAGKTGG